MNAIYVMYYTVLRNVRDKGTLINMLLLPIILILILGTALNGVFSPDTVQTISVAYVSEGGSMASYFEEFLQMDEIKKMIKTISTTSPEEGMDLIKEQKATAMIVIDGESPNTIQVHNSNYNSLKASIVKNIVDTFINGANTGEAVYKIDSEAISFAYSNNIIERSIGRDGKMPRAIDYYAVTMLVMILMYGANYGLYGFAEDYLEPVGSRVRSTPIKHYELFIGKTLGIVLTLFLDAIVLILFSKFVYQVNWGEDPASIIIIAFSLAVLSTGFGIMMCIICKDARRASGILDLLIPIFTLLSGGYTTINVDSSIFQSLRNLIPNYMAQKAMFNSIFGGPLSEVYTTIGVMWVAIGIIFIIAIFAGRRKI